MRFRMSGSRSNIVFCTSGEGICSGHVTALWSDKYSSKTHDSIDTHIENIWIQRKKENPHLFNGTKFRLGGVEVECPGNEKLPRVRFLLGNTSYKEFIGTNCSPNVKKVIQSLPSATTVVNVQDYMADPLGVGSLLETLDKKCVFIRRSEVCGEAQGMIDRPGGHPEPENIKLSDQKEVDSDVRSREVVEEIFSSVQNEIRDELNIPVETLGESFLLGVVFNKETNHRPSLEFYTRCFLSSEKVHSEYMKQTQLEKEESTDLVFISTSELLSLCCEKSGFLWSQLTPAAQGGIMMFSVCHSYHR